MKKCIITDSFFENPNSFTGCGDVVMDLSVDGYKKQEK